MSTARVLAIAAGGAASHGGGGAGGFRDETGIELVDFNEYEVVVGEAAANGENTFFKKADLDLLTVSSSFNAGDDATISHDVDVSTLLPNVGEIWAKITISGTREGRIDGVSVTLEGSNLDILYDGIYHFDVTSILSGKTEVTFTGRGDDNTATIAIVFEANHLIHSIGGGFGNSGSRANGKFGGSGGGGAGNDRDGAGSGGQNVPGQGFSGSGGSVSNGASGGTPSRPSRGGGGGGANQAGQPTSGGSGGDGGDGKLSDITGANVRYAAGGRGTPSASNGDGYANPGAGGDADAADKSGKDGIVVIRYTREDVTHTYVGGTITDVGGDRIHTFTSSGILSPFLPPLGAASLVSK